MTWRMPTRRLSKDDEEIDAHLLKARLEEFKEDVNENFQKDYKDSRNGTGTTGHFRDIARMLRVIDLHLIKDQIISIDGDAYNEVLTTLAKLPLPPSEPESREYGRRLSQPSSGKRNKLVLNLESEINQIRPFLVPAFPRRIEVQPMDAIDSSEVTMQPKQTTELATAPITEGVPSCHSINCCNGAS